MMKITKKIVLSVLLISFTASAFAAQLLDRVIAIVNDDVIMESQLETRLSQITSQYPAEQLPPIAELRKQLLNRLVEEALELEVARRAGVNIGESKLEETLARIAAGNGQTVEQFRASIESAGQPWYAAREQIRRELLLSQVQQGAVSARITVTEQEIRNFLESDEGKNQTATNYNVSHILLPISSETTPAELTAVAEEATEVYNAASAGEDFATLARTHSKSPDALEGGEFGWRRIEQLPSVFATHVEVMEIGEVTEPFRSGAGYHIVKLINKRGAEDQVVEQTEVRHILISPNAIRSEEQAREQILAVRERILAGEDFGELAAEFSEDHGSARRAGSLGWSMPGSFVPQFESTMNSAEIGEVSEPFLSQFGWHILEVTGRRDQNMSERYLEMQAENFIRSRKFYDELPRWRRELRDEAYISYKAPYDELM
ncbi:peptidylprolyl isomerase [uncultured Umboniibacter sp.]|uniref:peptidylprolyl isomerase n=1 Tax=uncultured Umboniibacter sp. TaxID=1798917 RepID=UPI00261774B2|nr:peptidylprolyl isomerase [uncultured Umboniibacter sp.]